ncbi:MAG: serine/threonine-protein kinase [Myxococcota bacterium]
MGTDAPMVKGSLIGDYEVVHPLRSGGMANLYLAKKRGAAGFSRQVAIKVVHPELAVDEDFVQLFLGEARLCAQIHHPNVVHVEDLGEREGRYFLVMEYVRGCSLSELLTKVANEGRRPTVQLAAHIAIKIAEGLHAAHEAVGETGQKLGVVHRDVSPQNVLLSLAGDVKLIDFGIAEAAGRATEGLGPVTGKLSYMPPEQAFGRPVDRRADVYALGVVLWELLTMRRLFVARSEEALLDKVRHPDVPAPHTISDDISEELSALVMKALEPDPQSRLVSAGDFSRRLGSLVPGAASLQPSQLSALLEQLMAEELKRSDPTRPVVMEGSGDASMAADPTRTLTLAVAGPVTWVPDPSSGTMLTPPGEEPQPEGVGLLPTVASKGLASPGLRSAPSGLSEPVIPLGAPKHAGKAWSDTEDSIHIPKSGRARWVGLATMAIVVVGAVTAGIGWASSSEPSTEPVSEIGAEPTMESMANPERDTPNEALRGTMVNDETLSATAVNEGTLHSATEPGDPTAPDLSVQESAQDEVAPERERTAAEEARRRERRERRRRERAAARENAAQENMASVPSMTGRRTIGGAVIVPYDE